MDSTMMLSVSGTPNLVIVADEDGENKNAFELAAQEASFVTDVTVHLQTQYTTETATSQIAVVPTLEEIEIEIKAAAQRRIETARRELAEIGFRIERERNARDAAYKAAQGRVKQTQLELDGLAGERAEMERRAQTFVTGDALKAMMEKIHLAFNVRQMELEDALAQANADVDDMKTEIQAGLISDGLELQLAEQNLERFENAAPDVADAVKNALEMQETLVAALQAVQDGMLRDAQTLLAKAKAGQADASQVQEIECALEEALLTQLAQDYIARIESQVEQLGAVRRIKKLMDEATAAGVEDRITPMAERALELARQAANVRFTLARPIADRLVREGFVPVVGDGRIEIWKPVVKNSRNGGSSWILDGVMVLRHDEWVMERPTVPVTRKEIPEHVQSSWWYKHLAKNETEASQ